MQVETIFSKLSEPRWNLPMTVAEGRRLLDELPHINAVNSEGETAMHYLVGAISRTAEDLAKRKGDLTLAATLQTILDRKLEIVGIALERKADLNIGDNGGYTALHQLCRGAPVPALTRLLIAHGADVNRTELSGKTPLMHSGLRHPEDFVAYADAGTNLDAQDEAGRTALMLAVQDECLWAVEALIARGADLELTGWADEVKGKRAIDLVKKRSPKLRALLEHPAGAAQVVNTSKAAKVVNNAKPAVERGGIPRAELERRLRPYVDAPFTLSSKATAMQVWKSPPRALLFIWSEASEEVKTRFAKSLRGLLGPQNTNLVIIGFTGDEKLGAKKNLAEVNLRLPHGVLYCDLDHCTHSVTPVEHFVLPLSSNWCGRLTSSIEELIG